MATASGIGTSRLRDPQSAGQDAARRAMAGLGERPPHVTLVFATTGYDQQTLLDGVRSVVGDGILTGCSGEGTISSEGSNETACTVAVMVMRSDRITFDAVFSDHLERSATACANEIAEQVRAARGDAPGLLLLFPDALRGSCSELIEELGRKLPSGVRMAGGAAGDRMQLNQTYQYHAGTVYSGAVSALLLSGELEFDLGVSHGCTPMGLPLTVTDADAGWVKTVDDQPAWSVFRDFLAGSPDQLTALGSVYLCFGEYVPDSSHPSGENVVVRVPLQLDEERGHLFFPAGLRTGAKIQMTRRDPDQMKTEARDTAAALADQRDREPALVLQFDCAGRGRSLLGDRADEHIFEPVRAAFPKSTPWIGFHTYGEIAPLGEHTYFHNYTVVLCAVYERPSGPSIEAARE